jgi:hypothetical protein
MLGSLQAVSQDIMVSSDVVSVLTKRPIRGSLDLVHRHFEEDILRLFLHVLAVSSFSFGSRFYEETNDVAMASLL